MLKKIIVCSILLLSVEALCQENDSINAFKLKREAELSKVLKKGFKPLNDLENLFNQVEAEKLQEILIDFKKQTGIEISIFTIGSGFTSKEKFETFTLGLTNFNTSDSERKMNINISKEFRRIRIHSSDALIKIISDEEVKAKVDSFFVSSFKEGKYFEGTFFGAKSLMELIQSNLKKYSNY